MMNKHLIILLVELLNVIDDRTAAIHISRKRKEGKQKKVKDLPAPGPQEENQEEFLGT